MVRVLIVDDSAFMRRTLSGLLGRDPGIEVAGTAINGEDALVKCKELDPDVVTMDIEMPKMDGLTALKHLMRENPLPVLMISSLTHEGAAVTLEALEEGALGYVTKLSSTSLPEVESFGKELAETVKAIARRKAIMRLRFRNQHMQSRREGAADASRSDAAGLAGRLDRPGTDGRTRSLTPSSRTGETLSSIRPGLGANRGGAGRLESPETDRVAGRVAGRAAGPAGVSRLETSRLGTGRPGASRLGDTAGMAGATERSAGVTRAGSLRSTLSSGGIGGKTLAQAQVTGLQITPSKGFDLLVIGVSTGGPPAVQKILLELPATLPVPVLVAQHMPASFTGPFAKRLDSLVPLTVKEADPEERLVPGTVYICPGGKHFRVELRKGLLTSLVTEEPKEALYKPSVNVLFETAGATLGRRVLGVMLTGMGNDGLEGSKILKAKGGTLLAQSEATCVVYGMPKAVVDAGLTDGIIDIEDMAKTLMRFF